MEFITILLSGLLGIVTVGGVVLDETAESAIRGQLADVERLSVRIDNRPSYQLAQGRIDRIRIAGRGLYPIAGVRVDVLDIETDAIAFDVANLDNGLGALEEPLRAAVRLVMTQDDIEQALTSPFVITQLQTAIAPFADDALEANPILDPGNHATNPAPNAATALEIDPQLLLDDDRLRLTIALSAEGTTITIALEFGIAIASGSRLAVTDLDLTLDGQTVPDVVKASVSRNLEAQLNLNRLEASGIVARYVDVTIRDRTLTIVGLVQLTPDS
jgi:hypothetical protein